VREKLERWRKDYNQVRPHSALDDQSPEAFAVSWVRSSACARTASPANDAPACTMRSSPASDPEPGPLFVAPPDVVKGAAEKLVVESPPMAADLPFYERFSLET
jgi:hypothetical protein